MSYRILRVVVLLVAAFLPLQLAPVATDAATGPTITAIATGYGHTCALTTSGRVKCWGYNDQGQLGNGTRTRSLRPVDVQGLPSGIRAIAVGGSSCALTSGGGVKCWGDNFFGGLGNGTTTDSPVPVDVLGLTSGVSSISAGSAHTCAVTTLGGVKCWGYNNHGQLGDGTTTDRSVPVAVSGLASGVRAVSAGYKHTCALTSAGGVKCWGSNFAGELGNDNPTDSRVPVDVSGLTSGVSEIAAAGISHTCALTNGGGVMCWGSNLSGELGNGTTIDSLTPVSSLVTDATAIASGDSHTCAVTAGGGVKCWGANEAGQLGYGKPTGFGIADPIDVELQSSRIAAIAAGGAHTCALAIGGGVMCWGSNAYGELGNGTTTSSSVPVVVTFAVEEPLLTTWTAPMGRYGVATLRVGATDRLAIAVKLFRPNAAYVLSLRRGDCRTLGRLVLAARVTTTRSGRATRTFTLTSAQKGRASLPLAIRFGTKCASFTASIATPTPTPGPTPTPTPTPTATPTRPSPAMAIPQLATNGTENYVDAFGSPYTRYRLTITNAADYALELFAEAPDLPTCGLNFSATRMWVSIYGAADSSYIYGFCALSAPSDLTQIWFDVPVGTDPPPGVYVTLTDRRTGQVVRSNTVSVSKPAS